MSLTDQAKNQLAKDFTELAIQNQLIRKCATASETAKQVSEFFNTIVETVGKTNVKE